MLDLNLPAKASPTGGAVVVLRMAERGTRRARAADIEGELHVTPW
jgi:hypothetical protein